MTDIPLDPVLAAEMHRFTRALQRRVGGFHGGGLEFADEGSCDDCSRVGDRFRAGRLRLCEACAGSRARVAATLATGGVQA